MDLLIGMALGLVSVILIVAIPLGFVLRTIGRDIDRKGPDADLLSQIEDWRNGK